MKKLSKKLLSVLLIIAMLIPTSTMTLTSNATDSSIEIGDYITLGTYYGESIVWRCVDIDENGPLMLSDKILCFKSFDAKGNHENYYRNKEGTNNWKNSALRYWLNSVGIVDWTNRPAIPNKESVYKGYNSYSEEEGFLSSFSSIELSQIKMVTQKTYINDLDSKYKDGGTGEFYQEGGKFDSSLNNINTSQYMHQYSNDKIFLLDLEQAEAVYHNLGSKYLTAIATKTAVKNDTSEKTGENENYHYWLRVPGTNGMSYENVVTVSDKEEISYMSAFSVRQATYYYSVGVRPAFYLDVDAWESAGEQFPEGYDPLLDKYGFTNPSHVVESKMYKTVYGTVKGSWLSFLHENGKAHGLCYGMASTTAALLQNRSTINSFTLLSPDMNLGNVEFISSIFESGYSSVLNMDALTFIKYGYVYQFASERDSSINNLRNLYSVVKSYVDGNGSCVVISIYHGTKNNRKHGHAILATGIKETDNEYIILIDDSNFLEQTELSISKDFSTWSYSVDGVTLSDGTPYNYNSSNGIIAYDIPGSVVYNLGLLAGAKTRTATNYLNENRLLVTSTSSLVENDNLSEIFVTEESDLATNDSLKLYWIAEDMNGIELSAENNNSEITVSDINSSVSAVLDSNEIANFHIDDNGTNSVNFSSENNENANIVFRSVDDEGEIITTTLTGTANGDEVVASETEDGIQVTGLNNITVTYETADGTAETTAKVDDGSTVNITVNDDENTVETDWQCKHPDDNHDGICDSCAEDFTKGCSCNCHSNAFMQFLHKILCFLYRIFGMEQYRYCGCGKAHW